MVWQGYFVLAAEAITYAAGQKLGEQIGGVLGAALSGTKEDQKAYEREVISRLNRIEMKIDDVLLFLYSRLPELLDQKLTTNFGKAARLNFEARRTTLNAYINHLDYDSNVSQEEISQLFDYTLATIESGNVVIGYGQLFYLSACQALISAMAGYARLAKFDQIYLKSLGATAKDVREKLLPWVDENIPSSYASKIARFEDEKTFADSVLNSLPNGIVIDAFNFPDMTILYWASIQRPGGGPPYFSEGGNAKLIKPQLDSPDKISAAASKFSLTVQPWWPLELKAPAATHQGVNRYHSALALVEESVSVSSNHPAAIEEMKIALRTIQAMIQCCDHLIHLE